MPIGLCSSEFFLPGALLCLLCTSYLLPPGCAAVVHTPDSYPDSLTDFHLCGGIDHPSFACDPDEFLNPGPDGTKGIQLLDQALQHIYENTECICDRNRSSLPNGGPVPFGQGLWIERCGKGPKRHGFTVSVAVLDRMEVTDEHRRHYRAGAHVPAIFAAELKNRLKRGQCNDDALIVLAINDSSIRTSTGGVAATLMSPSFILNTSHIAQKFFARRDFTRGLLHMIDQFAAKLGAPPRPSSEPDGWFDQHFWTFFPKAWRQSSWRWPLLIGILLLILLLIALITFVTLRRKKGRPEYTQGREQGREKQ